MVRVQFPSRHCGCLIALLASMCGASSVVASEPADRSSGEFVRRLQQRQLHRLAEVYCRQQLERVQYSGGDPAPWVLGLLDSLAGRALAVRDVTDRTLWDEADALAERYQRQLAGTRQGLEIGVRRQTVQLAYANWRLVAADLDADPEPRRRQVREMLRGISRSLQDLNHEATAMLRSQTSRDGTDQSRAIQSLQQQLQFVAGMAFLRHADAHEDRSPDRVHLLTEALEAFTALSRTMPVSDLTLESRLREIECLRCLHSFEIANQRLSQFPTDDIPAAIRSQFVLQQARLDMDQGNPRKAVQWLLTHQQQHPANNNLNERGEVMLALVEAYLELAKLDSSTAESAESQQWQNMALDVIRQMEQQVSTYWVRRAESRLAIRPVDTAGTTELDIMTRTADNLYRRQQHAEALAAYQRAAQLAVELELPPQQFALGLRAAAIQYQLRYFRPASDAFQQLARRFPQHDQAAQAHWMAIASEAELVRADPRSSTDYQRLLEEHLQTWPQSSWGDEARYWLGSLLMQQGQHSAVWRYWQAIDPASERFHQAMRELCRYYHRQLNDLAERPEAQQAMAQSAMAVCRQWQNTVSDQVHTAFSAADATLSVAEIGLLHGGMAPDEAMRLINAARSDEAPDAAFNHRLSALQGLTHALAKQYDEATLMWERVDWDNYELSLTIARRMHDALQHSSGKQGSDTELAKVQRWLVHRLLMTNSLQHNLQLKTWESVALAASGERTRAIARLEELAASSPRDTVVQRLLAELLELGDTDAEQRRAIDHWRTVVRLTPDTSDAWFRAKLGIVRGLLRTNEPTRASEMIGVLQALHPDLGGPAMKAEFLKLQSQIGDRR